MIGQFRMGKNRIDEIVAPLVKKGLKAVLLFGVVGPDVIKDNSGMCILYNYIFQKFILKEFFIHYY